MAGPAYHGRTHLPDGTDPVLFPGLKSATFNTGLSSRSITGGSYVEFDTSTIYSNDDSFGYLGVTGTPSKAKYIKLTEEGFYLAQGSVQFDSAFLMRHIQHEWHSHQPLYCGQRRRAA